MKQAFVALLIALAPVAAAAADSCSHKELASVPATLSKYNQLLVDATIDGQPAELAVDTGAAGSMMFQTAVTRLGLGQISTRTLAFGVDGRGLNTVAAVPSLTLGTLVSHGTQFAISPGGPDAAGTIAGLFGGDYLSNYDLEIDLADGRVNLFSKDHCPGKVVYWANEYYASDVTIGASGQIRLPVEIDGKRVDALLDTGAARTVLRLQVASARFDLGPSSPGVTEDGNSTGVGNVPLKTYRYRFKTMAFGGLLIHNPMIDLVPFRDTRPSLGSHIDTSELPEMLVGMDLIRHLRLYIAYGERRLYYTLSGAAPAKH